MALKPIKPGVVSQRNNNVVGKPFVKGQSGNPHGRPKRVMADGRSVAEIAREYTDEAIQVLAQIMQSGESESARVSAANSILDRGWGKATQPISGDDEQPSISLNHTVVLIKALPHE